MDNELKLVIDNRYNKAIQERKNLDIADSIEKINLFEKLLADSAVYWLRITNFKSSVSSESRLSKFTIFIDPQDSKGIYSGWDILDNETMEGLVNYIQFNDNNKNKRIFSSIKLMADKRDELGYLLIKRFINYFEKNIK